MKDKVDVTDLTIGMFVAELDRPWLDTPFLLQGFLIESQQEIDELRKHCNFVYVEPEQSTGSAYRAPPKETVAPPEEDRAKGSDAPVARTEGAAGGLWDTIMRILRAAFGAAPAELRNAREPARSAPAAPRPLSPGEGEAPVQRGSSAISAAELDHLVAPAGAGTNGRVPDGGAAVEGGWLGWLATVRSWFGSGARIRKRHHDDEPPEADVPPPVYPDLSTLQDEIPAAREAHERTRAVVDQIVADIRADKPIELRKVQDAVLSMVESVVRNANGLMWLARLKARDATAYDHSLTVAVYLLTFGRHLGLPKGLLETLGTAGLMQDLGKLRLPTALLDKRTPLTAGEFDELKSHVKHSIAILEASSNASPVLLETVAQHHERYDGSGYPQGLSGEAISMLGAMAGIVDTYVAMTSPRPYRAAAFPQEVLQKLYRWRGTLFNPDLVEKFIQCIGIFPVGSLVELNTGEIAIVMAHSQIRRLKPRIMLILDPGRQPYGTPIVLDLIHNPLAPGGEPYRIVRGLQEDADTGSAAVYDRVASAEVRQIHPAA